MELDDNQLTAFPDFTFCKDTIEVISAIFNQITRLSLSILSHFGALSVLNLFGNQLTFVEPLQEGQTLLSIMQINVGYNHLSSFPELCQPSPKGNDPNLVIYLTDNPLHCGTCLAWLKKCPYDIIIAEYADPTCASPVELHGTDFESVTLEQLQNTTCEEPSDQATAEIHISNYNFYTF